MEVRDFELGDGGARRVCICLYVSILFWCILSLLQGELPLLAIGHRAVFYQEIIMKNFLLTTAAVTALFLPSQAYAQIENYSFDKAHTQIIFSVSHLGFSHSHGKFLNYDGGFVFDRGEPTKSSVNVTIQTAGIDMDDEKWDEHLKSADFFDVEKFPTMTFKSTGFEVTGEKTGKMTGDLTLLGITKPVTLDVVHNKSDVHAFSGKYVSGFTATGSLKRSDFGMNYGLPMVGDEVSLQIEVEGLRDELGGEAAGTN